MDDSEPTLAQRTHEEVAWQKLAAPLVAIREIREVVLFAVLSSDDPAQAQQDLLRDVCKIESRLLKKCLARDRGRTLELLCLDHRQSWQEVVDFLRSSGKVQQSTEIRDWAAKAKMVLAQIDVDLE